MNQVFFRFFLQHVFLFNLDRRKAPHLKSHIPIKKLYPDSPPPRENITAKPDCPKNNHRNLIVYIVYIIYIMYICSKNR